ncbi:MAG: hypothetical protein F9K23_15760 [Bacteroidetes bacterium]|nr:MAG: hypothetical protein F9K23_15760 [Bacteroidota bacterium]
MKNTIYSIQTLPQGYGHWSITLDIDNPALNYSDEDYYWVETGNTKEDEPKTIKIKHITTNAGAIDGNDGFEHSLAKECLIANDLDTEYFDFSLLKSEK